MSLEAFFSSPLEAALAGGAILGASASLLLILNGRVAGISGIVAGLVSSDSKERGWRLVFVAGLLAGGFLFSLLRPQAFAVEVHRGAATTVLAGLLVGVGTRLSGGCTSGHGVCGISRLSKRSFLATATFLATGMLTVFVGRHMLGGGP